MPKTTKAPLSKKERDVIETELLRQRKRVLRSSQGLRELAAEEASTGGDAADKSSDAVTREHATLMATREGARYRAIQDALDRLHTAPETFGLCESCGDEIGFERLEFLPTTTACIQHAA